MTILNHHPCAQVQPGNEVSQAALEHELLGAIIEASKDAIICTDIEGLILTFSPGAERMFGVSAVAMAGQSIDLLLPQRYRDHHAKHRAAFGQDGHTHRSMGQRLVKGLRADGTEIDVDATVIRIRAAGQERLMAILHDASRRVQADIELQTSRAQLSELAGKLMLQEKNLVKRMASAMHDHLGQTLATIRMVHDTMQMTTWTQATPELARLDQQLGELIKKAVQEVRQVLIDLHPPLLDENGLAAALNNELRSRQLVTSQVTLTLDVPQQLSTTRWPMAVEYAAFMIAREALDNALRHAGASQIDVRLRGGALLLQMEVRDDGNGYAWDGKPRPGHLGITGMRERAKSIGADLTLGPAEPQGWRVALRWEPMP